MNRDDQMCIPFKKISYGYALTMLQTEKLKGGEGAYVTLEVYAQLSLKLVVSAP